jgi:hypothetical protein
MSVKKGDTTLLLAAAAAVGAACCMYTLTARWEKKKSMLYRLPAAILSSPYANEIQVAIDVALKGE